VISRKAIFIACFVPIIIIFVFLVVGKFARRSALPIEAPALDFSAPKTTQPQPLSGVSPYFQVGDPIAASNRLPETFDVQDNRVPGEGDTEGQDSFPGATDQSSMDEISAVDLQARLEETQMRSTTRREYRLAAQVEKRALRQAFRQRINEIAAEKETIIEQLKLTQSPEERREIEWQLQELREAEKEARKSFQHELAVLKH